MGKDRKKLTGARWSREGAEAVLRLRPLGVSSDFEADWRFHLEQEYKRNHTTHYVDGKIPRDQSKLGRQGKGAHLQLIK